MWDAVWSLLQPQPWHPSIIRITQFFKICPPHPSQELQCKGEPICPFTAYQGAKTKTLCTHLIWIWDAVSLAVFSLNHDNPTSLGFAHTLIFQKLAPSYLHMYFSVRVNPYAHPQHIKVLKHIVCILYECGLQSEAFAALTMTPHHHSGLLIPQFFKIWPLAGVFNGIIDLYVTDCS
jgi:hypothetical protein